MVIFTKLNETNVYMWMVFFSEEFIHSKICVTIIPGGSQECNNQDMYLPHWIPQDTGLY